MPTSSTRYLDFVGASSALEEARAAAEETGRVRAIPPTQLGDCDRSVIESALGAPRAGWGAYERYPDLAWKAAALLYALAKSQACPDGNKRIAAILTVTFLDLNGAWLDTAPEDLAQRIRAAAGSDAHDRLTQLRELYEWLASSIRSEEEDHEA